MESQFNLILMKENQANIINVLQAQNYNYNETKEEQHHVQDNTKQQTILLDQQIYNNSIYSDEQILLDFQEPQFIPEIQQDSREHQET